MRNCRNQTSWIVWGPGKQRGMRGDLFLLFPSFSSQLKGKIIQCLFPGSTGWLARASISRQKGTVCQTRAAVTPQGKSHTGTKFCWLVEIKDSYSQFLNMNYQSYWLRKDCLGTGVVVKVGWAAVWVSASHKGVPRLNYCICFKSKLLIMYTLGGLGWSSWLLALEVAHTEG